MTAQNRDPFEQLIDACQTALTFVTEREATASAAARTRTEQRQRIEKAMQALTGGKIGKAMKREGSTSNLICKACGNHFASKAHKESCVSRREAAEAPAPLDATAPAVEAS